MIWGSETMKCTWCGETCKDNQGSCPACGSLMTTESCGKSINNCTWCVGTRQCLNSTMTCQQQEIELTFSVEGNETLNMTELVKEVAQVLGLEEDQVTAVITVQENNKIVVVVTLPETTPVSIEMLVSPTIQQDSTKRMLRYAVSYRRRVLNPIEVSGTQHKQNEHHIIHMVVVIMFMLSFILF